MIKLKLPTRIEDCRPDQLTKWIMLTDAMKERQDDEWIGMIEFQCQMLSIFSGLSTNKIKKGNIQDVQEASNALFTMLAEYKSSDPVGTIEIEGNQYHFNKDFNLITTGQIIDLKLIEDIASDPCKAVAICYIEEDMDYCHEDAKGRIINPTDVRYKLFKQHFPGDEFLNFFGFFLREYEKRNLAILAIQQLRTMKTQLEMDQQLRIANGSLGQLSFIDYQKRWDKTWKKLRRNLM
jgi:hypothetical protein